MAYRDKRYLSEKVLELLARQHPKRLLDVGCGDGFLANRAKGLGFQVSACDLDDGRLGLSSEIEFKKADLSKKLPFENESFDYITFLEVIEHLEAPYFAISELNRILSRSGSLFLSTPNILNLKSRMRFLFEGAFEFFREPILEQLNNSEVPIPAIHIIAYRFHELEYLLFKNRFRIKGIFTDLYLPAAKRLGFLKPLLKLQLSSKRKRSSKKGGLDYRRIHEVLLSDELLYGRHLIIKAEKINTDD